MTVPTRVNLSQTARSSLGKIFGDLIERVRFARTLRWSKADSNSRSHPRATPPAATRFVADSALDKDRFELPVPPKTLGVLAVVLSRSRRLSLAEKPLPDLLGPYEGSESVRSRCRDHQEEFRVMAMWKCSVSGAALCRRKTDASSRLARKTHFQ